MDITEVRAFAASNHRAVLVTTRADGRPLTTPVLCGVDPQGKVVVSTQGASAKVRNIARHPEVALCVLNDGFFGPWLQVDGRAEIVPLPDAMEGLVELYRQISGEHPDWDEFRQAMQDQRRVLLRIDLDAGAGRDG